MFFDNWPELGRVFVVGILAYLSAIILLRLSGKRTLSKLNTFDFLVTVALGSTLASMILNKDVALTEGFAAFCVLILSQFVITSLSVRSSTFQHLIKSDPTLIYHKQHFLKKAMQRERVTEEEVRAIIRESGHLSLEGVTAVVLETDGSFSVLGTLDHRPDNSSLANVELPKNK